MLFEAGPEMIDSMPSYDELLSMLHLKLKKQTNGIRDISAYAEIERLQKTYRCHRDANCIDGKFISDVMQQTF